MVDISLLKCRSCGFGLKKINSILICKKCGLSYGSVNEIIDFLNEKDKKDFTSESTSDLKFQIEEMSNNSILAKTYNIGSQLISCDYVPNNQLNYFIKLIDSKKIFVELGSGNRRLSENCINIDIFPFKNVDILADIINIPFKNSSVDYVVIDAVLEHVPEPQMVVNEIFRILKPEGKVFCVVPFVHPYHGYPKNYFNISVDGLNYLFRNFKKCNVEIYRGPSSALINLMSEYTSLAFSNNTNGVFRLLVKGITLVPLFIFKYFDKFWNSKGKGIRISSALCATVTK